MEFNVTEDFILRKGTAKLDIPLNEKIKLLDQENGKYYLVPPGSTYRMESTAQFYDTGWQSDQYEINQIEIRPSKEGDWTCFDIIESSQSSEHNPFGSGNESKKITRVCKIPELEDLIKDERYYKFFGFYRTDIDLPFKGIAIKYWIEYPDQNDIAEDNFTIFELTEIKEVQGTPVEIEQILSLPIDHR